jgi:predicted nucleic acid-binding Zn ribbon protein
VTARSTPGRKSAARRTTARTPRTGRVSGAHPDDRDPQTLDTALTRVVDDHGWQVDLKVASMFARWGELVGSEIGSHSRAESFADGKLVVRTDSTAWATQLRLLAPSVVRRLNDDLGHGTVVVIEVLGPHAPSWKHGTRSVRDGRGPRDTYG